MKRNPVLILILSLALVSMACGIRFNVPLVEVKTGPTVTEDIAIPLPEAAGDPVRLVLAFGAGEMSLSPGAEGDLVTGTATYNVPDFKPAWTVNDNSVRLEQGDLEIRGIPDFDERIRNEWDLQLGEAPLDLEIQAGGYKADYELGGLALQELRITDGAADVDLAFSEPNLVELEDFRYITGASNITLSGLANANFSSMVFQSGAGNYRLDFGGELQRGADVRIETGFSTFTIIVPEGVNAVLEIDGGFSNVDANGDWMREGDEYILAGSGPTLRFVVRMGAGTLQLEN